MKRIAQVLISSLILTITAAPARSLTIAGSLSCALANSIEESKPHARANRASHGVNYVLSIFNKAIVRTFGKEWGRAGNGTFPQEGVVLILRNADGTYIGKDMGCTNEYRRFTFRWIPGTIAIVHTHPNTSDPRPHDEDLVVADKFEVPVFTITSRGMYVYDPATKKISRVVDNLDWLDASKLGRAVFASRQLNPAIGSSAGILVSLFGPSVPQ